MMDLFIIAPTAMQRMAHPDGECATARGLHQFTIKKKEVQFPHEAFFIDGTAAAAHNIVYILSTIATSSIEEIAAAAPNGTNWFQLYIYKDRQPIFISKGFLTTYLVNVTIFLFPIRQATIDLIRRAEKANFKALVVTVDTAVLGRRLVNEKHGFDLPAHLKQLSTTLRDIQLYPHQFLNHRLGNFNEVDEKSNFQTQKKEGSRLAAYAQMMFDPSLTWKDIDWLRRYNLSVAFQMC